MDISASVQSDRLRPISAILVPGLAAAFPYAALFLSVKSSVATYFSSHEATSIIVIAFVGIAIGLIVDAIGRSIESQIIDSMHKDCMEVQREWFKYLTLVHEKDPIGQRFLRRVLMQFKFELNFGIAIIIAMPGTIWWFYLSCVVSHLTCWIIIGALLALVFYLFWEAKRDSELLSKLRHVLLYGVDEKEHEEAS